MGSKKATHTSFFPVTSTNVGISPKLFGLLVLSLLIHWWILPLKVISSTSPKLLKLNQDHLSKKEFFRSNPYKIEIMITSVIEMFQIPNLCHMTSSTI